MSADYTALKDELAGFIDPTRLIDDPLRTLAYGTDASFYRLIPRLVVKVNDESEMVRILAAAHRCDTPVTFRAAGTSLSGQAISDSVLLLLSGDYWRGYTINEDASIIRLQPGVVGAWANSYLAPYQRKIGPDPASINAAKIGGIAANNASGMCCGTAQNSYHTLANLRVVLADGTVLDSAEPASVTAFRESHGDLLATLSVLAAETRANAELAERIRHKYRLKNTTGYSLNALIDFEDPIDILQHLMIGSEGTLGFISEIGYHTVPDHPCKSTALILFPTVEIACRAVVLLKQTPVTAVELMDRAALRSVQEKPGMPAWLRELDDEVAALLVDVRAADEATLKCRVADVGQALVPIPLVREAEFTADPTAYQALWNIRKGLFPAVGAVRTTGTTVIIEDIAFPVPQLAAAVRGLHLLFEKYHYHEALIFGHALEGNLHFVFTQDFSTEEEVRRYQGLMDEVCALVVADYGGSLKAEHGTGRNMAPFVEMEWGSDAYRLMWRLKKLFDPANLLNPGVILNEDAEIHLKNLKPLPPADPLIDKCIECGFCEPICPSRNLTLTPRQRIVSWREISRLKTTGEDVRRLQQFETDFAYQGLETCAVDGLCAIECPVGIDTGKLTRQIRQTQQGAGAARVGDWVDSHFAGVAALTRAGLKLAALSQDLLGDRLMGRTTGLMRRLSGGRIPQWNPAMPRAAGRLRPPVSGADAYNGTVVYFPSCASRTMGPAKGDAFQDDLHQVMQNLLGKAGYRVILPERPEGLCCGMALESKGLPEQAERSLRRLEQALWDASEQGRHPVLCDTSPCTYRMIEQIEQPLRIYEPVGFIGEHLLAHLKRTSQMESVALHITCSSRKMGLAGAMRRLAEQCARQVFISEDKGCCGFAGDKGFARPELNASALGLLSGSLPQHCEMGVSNSRTCEIGLSLHAGLSYQSIVYLVDRCFVAR
ncbi:FAD-binding and (Fe-S)-binding domain-containing protein [Sedimenticola hydrogenitrophicus]|uniref:FAD-binding and (Fe-S)-binding domain-containing protein n=1 Tax=Sedimenticola hydrogenitrophicus TaxID=2967975 RepID=UPI0023AECEE8|nr:FAD-binding and (Fe-S)-binding domain-containing protein [Sedimenticola hydrogenitrophicus]